MSVADVVLERERLFHNERFAGDSREAQEKYYFAVQPCEDALWSAVQAAAVGKTVLEYGCAKGERSFELAPTAAWVDGIDISDVAIDQASQRAAAEGVTNTRFTVGDAQNTPYADETFDVVFGSGIIHHLDTEKSLREIYRILKPGGVAIFKEPLGCNVVINLYRAITPHARTDDEHPLLPIDHRISRDVFDDVEWSFYGLLTLAAVPLRTTPMAGAVRRAAAAGDRLLSRVPGLRWQLWYSLMVMRKA